MRTLRTLVALVAMTGLTFALSCGPGGGDDDPELCTNGVDDDGDGLADCADPECATNPYCTANPCDHDNVCDTGENTTNCPDDCPAATCNNDGDCDTGETTANCPDDCPAATCNNDGDCDAGETTANCPDDCPAAGTCDAIADIITQDGCDTGDKCTIVDTAGTIDCVANGTVGIGLDCGGGGTDDCLAGMVCMSLQGETGNTCKQACDATHTCPTDYVCSVNVTTPAGALTICAATDDCDPFDATNCNTGEGCYIVSAAGDTMCITAGTNALGASCTYLNECGIGATCYGAQGSSVCTEFCHETADCTSGTCQGVGQIPGHTTLGVCQP